MAGAQLPSYIVKVKNTFLDDWEDEDCFKHVTTRRPYKSCPFKFPLKDLEDEKEPETYAMKVPSPQYASEQESAFMCSSKTASPAASPTASESTLVSESDQWKMLHQLMDEDEADPEEPLYVRHAASSRPRMLPALPLQSASSSSTTLWLGDEDDLPSPAPRVAEHHKRGGAVVRLSDHVIELGAVDSPSAGGFSATSASRQRRLRRCRRAAALAEQEAHEVQRPRHFSLAPTHTAGPRHNPKLWCHIYLDERMLIAGFGLNKKIIGHGGCCTRGIYEATGAKVRLRGRGSKHLEGGREAPVHLMLAVTVERGEKELFKKAIRMAVAHLRMVENRFVAFCRHQNKEHPGECFWIGELPEKGRACLESTLTELGVAVLQPGDGSISLGRP